jgi:hypothetical protein
MRWFMLKRLLNYDRCWQVVVNYKFDCNVKKKIYCHNFESILFQNILYLFIYSQKPTVKMKIKILCFVLSVVVASATAAPAESTTSNNLGRSTVGSTMNEGRNSASGTVGHQLTTGVNI